MADTMELLMDQNAIRSREKGRRAYASRSSLCDAELSWEQCAVRGDIESKRSMFVILVGRTLC